MSMGKVKVTIRLYRLHDPDLLTLMNTHNLSLRKTAYCVLKAFSKGEFFVISIPPVNELNYEMAKKVYTSMLILDSEKDADIIEMLSYIQDGYRNNFIKTLLRLYLSFPASEMFLVDSESSKKDLFFSKFDIFRVNRRVVDTGSELSKRGKGNKVHKKDNIKFSQTELSEVNNNEIKDDEIKESVDSANYSDINNNDSNVNDEQELTDLFTSIIG